MTSLFERMGGKETVDAMVDRFYERVLADPSINHFFMRVDLKRHIALQKEFLASAFGGSAGYSGRDIREAHKYLTLEEEHFNAVLRHLKRTLSELRLPEAIQGDIMDIAAGMHDAVLDLQEA